MHRLILTAAVVACLLPFAGKPFHIDDPMYIWAARHITTDPLGFYDFQVNWYGALAPMYELNKNPPLVSFYLALVGLTLGWSEPALHLGMMLPAIAMALGVYALARRLCGRPLLATALAWMTPVSVVSATTIMSDVLMLALWCWAAALWIEGIDAGRPRRLLLAAILLGLCPLAKYFGLALIPLLIVYAAGRTRRVGAWAGALVIPALIVGAYQLYMRLRLGWDPLADVAHYALTLDAKHVYTPAAQTLVGTWFLGGCLLTTLFVAPLLWSRRLLVAGGALAVALALLLARMPAFGPLALATAAGPRWDLIAQMALFGLAGGQLLALAGRELWEDRSTQTLVLALWLVGVWVFASYTNWTTTARAILPAAPAAALLVVRALERRHPDRTDTQPVVAVALGLGLLVALGVARADLALAASARTAALQLGTEYAGRPRPVLFQGAWGFQEYMQTTGAIRVDFDHARFYAGDIVVTPALNTNLVTLPAFAVEEIETVALPAGSVVTTMSQERGAGFYAALYGPLPFSFGPVPKQRYTVARITRPLAFHP